MLERAGIWRKALGLRFCECCSEEVDLRGLTEGAYTLNLRAKCAQRKRIIEKILSVCSFSKYTDKD